MTHNCTVGHTSQKNEDLFLCTNLHGNVHSTFIYNSPKPETICISFKGFQRLKALTYWGIHPTEWHSAITKNNLWVHAATRINLKGMMLKEKARSQKGYA